MRIDDAKAKIIAAMRERLPSIPYSGTDGGFTCYNQLRKDCPDLFEFRCSGDQWQRVHGWLRRAGLVTE